MVAVIQEQALEGWLISSLAFHPTMPLLATAGSNPDALDGKQCELIHIYELDYGLLLKQRTGIDYTSAKVVLVGDSGVGKTGLGWRLAKGEFKEHASTHGQQFWLLDQLCRKRLDGTQGEEVLWEGLGRRSGRQAGAFLRSSGRGCRKWDKDGYK